MKNIIGFLTAIGLSWVAWQAWFPPETISEQADVRAWLPPRPDLGAGEQEKWRVFTRRMVWKKAVESFQERLKEIVALRGKIRTGLASEQQINTYYDFRIKRISDRVQLLEYVAGLRRTQMGSKRKKIYFAEILQAQKIVLGSLEKERERALKKVQ